MSCLIWGALGLWVVGCGLVVWAACALASKIDDWEHDGDE
jgi:hypothetical protein